MYGRVAVSVSFVRPNERGTPPELQRQHYGDYRRNFVMFYMRPAASSPVGCPGSRVHNEIVCQRVDQAWREGEHNPSEE